jgi:hypothetical protein
MKAIKLLIALVFMLSIIFTVAPSPVIAGTETTQVTGKAFFTGYDATNEKYWVSDDNIVHFRDLINEYKIKSNNGRLNGKAVFIFNADFKPTDDIGGEYGQFWGSMTLTNKGGWWTCNLVGFRAENGYTTMKTDLHGYGDYEGLFAKVDWVRSNSDFSAPLTITGEIMEMGD